MRDRPKEPKRDQNVWYRGWEITWNEQSHFWCDLGWDAYKGGCDIDVPRVMATGWDACLDEIDEHEDEA